MMTINVPLPFLGKLLEISSKGKNIRLPHLTRGKLTRFIGQHIRRVRSSVPVYVFRMLETISFLYCGIQVTNNFISDFGEDLSLISKS